MGIGRPYHNYNNNDTEEQYFSNTFRMIFTSWWMINTDSQSECILLAHLKMQWHNCKDAYDKQNVIVR